MCIEETIGREKSNSTRGLQNSKKITMLIAMSVYYSEKNTSYGYNFINGEYIPAGKDEYYLRNEQSAELLGSGTLPKWQHLTPTQIEQLEKNGNRSPNWNDVLVSEQFEVSSIRNSQFYGLVRLGKIGTGTLQFHDFSLPEGIYDSCLISCDIGDHCAVHSCLYLSHYIIGHNSILHRIDEMDCTNHSKNGNGIIKQGEDEAVRVWIEPLNEAGGREVLPFYDMICADAYMWTIFRDDTDLMKALFDMTNNTYDLRRGFYGTIGSNCVIKSCRIIKDVAVGSHAYIKGANKLKNLSIKSDENAETQIGEGVELVNGIIGYGCHIFYGCKAVRFVIGNNSNLKYGSRLIHSILGDNSTVSCCEVLNNLVFPGHEQHHNNSFLIASLIMGQSNMAAGATVGSNHNSRGNDGEIIAGRGFWPGLSSTLKHNSRFASYTLITKGNYPSEINIPLPFSMLIENPQHNRLEVMPAYYWMYNMYALERNSWKYRTRDKRFYKTQHIVSEYLAPDTICEIIAAMKLLEEWTGKAVYRHLGENLSASTEQITARGRKYLREKPEVVQKLQITGENMERSKRPVQIIKCAEAYRAYQQMLTMYAVKAILTSLENSSSTFIEFVQKQAEKAKNGSALKNPLNWLNLGGQLMPESRFNTLKEKIISKELAKWPQVHAEYDAIWALYSDDCAELALEVLKYLYGTVNAQTWVTACDQARTIRAFMEDQVYKTKLKDYTNTFRSITYRNQKERFAVLGKVEDNSFIKTAKEETKEFLDRLARFC